MGLPKRFQITDFFLFLKQVQPESCQQCVVTYLMFQVHKFCRIVVYINVNARIAAEMNELDNVLTIEIQSFRSSSKRSLRPSVISKGR